MNEIVKQRIAVWSYGILAGTLILIGVAIGFHLLMEPRSAQRLCLAYETTLGDDRYAVAIADKPRAKEVGLMFRDDLATGEGMLFLYKDPQHLSFWMRNTPVPLDVIFLTRERRVINIEHGEPHSLAPMESDAPAQLVLEIPAGEARRLGLVVGKQIGPFTKMSDEICRD